MNDPQFDHSKPHHAPYSQNGRHRPALTQEEIDRQEPDLAERRQEDAIATRKGLKRLYIILLTVGIGLGAIVSVGVVLLLDRFDLINPQTEISEPNE